MKKNTVCPVCGIAAMKEMAPFCSQRCADVDLGRWLRGVYRVETAETPQTAESGESEPQN
ncbi:MAG: DNA gyrase inhibitor YacG [Bdellovibrionales bacterium]